MPLSGWRALVPLLLLSGLTAGETAPGEEAATRPPEEIVVPAGTVVPIALSDYLNTKSSKEGDVFYADTTYPVWIDQRLVIPRGSTLRGTVTMVERPGRIRGKGRMAVRFDDILLPNGIRRDLSASFRGLHGPGDESMERGSETVTAAGSEGEDAGTIVGTTAQGAIIGAVIGRGSGAAVGAGAGAAAGVASVLFSRGRDLVIAPGTRFDLELLKPLRFSYLEMEFSADEIREAGRNGERRPQVSQPQPPASNRRTIGISPGIGIPW